MKNILSLAGSLLRGGGRRTILDLSLTVVGVAIPVAVILLVVGTVTGFRERENAMAWREPTPATAEATALQRRSYQPWKGRRVDIVELRAIESTPPVPPGMDRFPREGEVWVSPALREALDEDGWFTFEQRVGGQIVGLLEDEALAHDDELVAVVGNGSLEPTPEDELLPYDHRHGGGFLPSDVLPVSEFAESGEDPGLPLLYMVSAWIAGALLVAPSISLLGAGARLTAARRGRRLAALRLAGATSGQVTALAALETAFGAVLGIGLGVAVALVGMAVVSSRIPLGGGRFSFSDLLPSPLAVSVILVGALLVAVASALAGLREVRTTPLGVVRQGRRKRPGWRRFLVMVVAWTAFIATIPFTQGTGEYVVLVAGLAVVILSISTVGPVFAWFMGWLTIRLTRGPRGLVAGRRLMADPIGSFRPTTGLVLISFVAGFLLLSSATLPEVSTNDSALVLATFGPGDRSDATEWRQKLADVYPQATFDESAHGDLAIMLPPGADVEAERARIAGITGTFPLTEAELDFENRLFTDDVRRAVWVVVAIALIQAAAATGVGSAASVLEQANTLAALSLTGTPTSQLQGARALQSAIPITVSSAVFVTLGAAAGGLTIVGIQPDVTIVVPSLVQAALVVVAAAVAAVAGTSLSRPVLQSVLTQPLAER
ncbi:MAG TPA: FtsX-like permease family protein [Acidimicrobiia bacterium]|nr:FtsX-like permease family protein [Acidimicrobiia bacterium]